MSKSKYVLTGVTIADSDLKRISKKLRFSFDRTLTDAYGTFGLAKKNDDFRITFNKSVGRGVKTPALGGGRPSGPRGAKTLKEIIARFPKSRFGFSYRCPACEATAPPVTFLVLQACGMGRASHVTVQCSNGHWATYGCAKCSSPGEENMKTTTPAEVPQTAPDEAPEDQIGIRMPPDEIDLLHRFREKYLPDALLQTQDEFAKWLFGLTAAIAALGAGFSNAAFAKLNGLGVLSFGLSVLFAGIGLSIATYSLSIGLPDANWHSLPTMYAAMKSPLKKKRWSIRLAAFFLALALFAAGSAPLLSLVKLGDRSGTPNLTYSIVKDTVECSLSCAKLKKGSRFSVSVYGAGADNQEMLVGAVSEVVRSRGKSSIKVSNSSLPADLVSMRFIGSYTRDSEGAKEESEEIKVVIKTTPKGPSKN